MITRSTTTHTFIWQRWGEVRWSQASLVTWRAGGGRTNGEQIKMAAAFKIDLETPRERNSDRVQWLTDRLNTARLDRSIEDQWLLFFWAHVFFRRLLTVLAALPFERRSIVADTNQKHKRPSIPEQISNKDKRWNKGEGGGAGPSRLGWIEFSEMKGNSGKV